MPMPNRARFSALASALIFAVTGSAQWPGSASEKGVDFPLPAQRQVGGRRMSSMSNAMTMTWDGKVMMFISDDYSTWPNPGWPYPASYRTAWGYVFTTFKKANIQVVSGRPDFSNCFGTLLRRFSGVAPSAPYTYVSPGLTANTYPDPSFPYPAVDGTVGEFGLLAVEMLPNNLYPVPDAQLQAMNGAKTNPYPSTASGVPASGAGFRTYRAYLLNEDKPRFWQASTATWGASIKYENPRNGSNPDHVYPNGVSIPYPNTENEIKRVGRGMIDIIVNETTEEVAAVNVVQKWAPYQVACSSTAVNLTVGKSIPSATTMWLDVFEPTMSNDGHLIVGKGSTKLVAPDNVTTYHAHIVFFYNQTAFGLTGWTGPFHLHRLNLMKDTVVDGMTLGERYPLAQQPIRGYDGKVYGDANNNGQLEAAEANAIGFEGGYTWLDPDGRFLMYSVFSGGVGYGHPQITASGLNDQGSSDRAQASIVGSVTGWQQWRIDHPAENPSRHYFTAYDEDSRTVHVRNMFLGMSPGFWDNLRGAPGVPLRADGNTKIHLVQSQRLLYYELDLSPYMEHDYGFYLPMTEMLKLDFYDDRDVDLGKTPDLSGKGNFGIVDTGAQLPCEYFKLPSRINNYPASGAWTSDRRIVPGLYAGVVAADPATAAQLICPGWTASDVVAGGGTYWAKLADGQGRGSDRDMDSDTVYGRVGQAMFFLGNGRVRVANNGQKPELNPGTLVTGASTEFTVSLWVHPLQAANCTLFRHVPTCEIMLASNGSITAVVGGASRTSASGTAPVNAWTHVAVTWKATGPSSSTMKLFLNGVMVGTAATIGQASFVASTSDIEIGCMSSSVSNSSAVLLLDEVALKNSAMVEADLSNLALQAVTPPVGVPPPGSTWTSANLPSAPLGLSNSDSRVPAAIGYNPAVAALGADLFHDQRLSSTNTVSCATCHIPSLGFQDNAAVSVGVGGATLRSTPTIFNQRFQTAQFWDARVPDLEAQALVPVFGSEMGMTSSALLAYLNDPNGAYLARFQSKMGVTTVTENEVRIALASFMRSPTTGNAAADQGTLSASALNGKALFEGKARCIGCHNGRNFTDGLLWNTGSAHVLGTDNGAGNANAGPRTARHRRFEGAFKTPTLRDIARSAPYFHDGSAPTLAAVVDFYDAGGVRTDGHGLPLQAPLGSQPDPRRELVSSEMNRRLGLSSAEKADLVNYLIGLTSNTRDQGAVGFNVAPTVALHGATSGGGPVLVVAVSDADGSEIDPKLKWTLEVTISGVSGPLNWTHATVATVGGVIQATFPLSQPFSSFAPGSITAKAADYHGLWCKLVMN